MVFQLWISLRAVGSETASVQSPGHGQQVGGKCFVKECQEAPVSRRATIRALISRESVVSFQIFVEPR